MEVWNLIKCKSSCFQFQLTPPFENLFRRTKMFLISIVRDQINFLLSILRKKMLFVADLLTEIQFMADFRILDTICCRFMFFDTLCGLWQILGLNTTNCGMEFNFY